MCTVKYCNFDQIKVLFIYSSVIFWGIWGSSKNWLKPKNFITTTTKLSLSKSPIQTVYCKYKLNFRGRYLVCTSPPTSLYTVCRYLKKIFLFAGKHFLISNFFLYHSMRTQGPHIQKKTSIYKRKVLKWNKN